MDYFPWLSWWNLAPQQLTQPIQPGWSFGNIVTVNQKNSRSPDTEHQIVAEHSYGRQLGRLMDAVAALIAERPANAPERKAFDELFALRQSIEAIKSHSEALRLMRLEEDLEDLRQRSPQDYQRIAAKLARDAAA